MEDNEKISISQVRLESRAGRLVAVIPPGTPPMEPGLIDRLLNDLREGRSTS